MTIILDFQKKLVSIVVIDSNLLLSYTTNYLVLRVVLTTQTI